MLRLITWLILIGLTPGYAHSDDYLIWGDFREQIKSFMLEADKHGKHVSLQHLTIQFTRSLSNDWVGACYPSANTNHKRIMITKSYWYSIDSVAKQQLIFHELGHCVLNRDHNDLKVNGHPVSIMYYNMDVSESDRTWYISHQKEYLDELFR